MRKVFSFLIMFLLMTSFCFANSIEIADTTAHYAHPITGNIEDSGANPEIGQGMSESVLHPQALLETDDNGNIYATFRFNMADQISSFKISTQKQGDSSFKASNFSVMQKLGNSVDLRVKVPSKNAIIRVSAFVDAMGREVVFFGKLGNTTEGNTNFVVSLKEPKQENEIDNNKKEANSKEKSNATKPDDLTEDNKKSEAEGQQSDTVKSESNEEKISEINLNDKTIGLLLKGDRRLEGDYERSHIVEDEEIIEYGELTKMAISSLYYVFAMISVLTFIAGVLCLYFRLKLRKSNDIKEAKAYGLHKK